MRAWFGVLRRQEKLIITAITETAAFNIFGITRHSAVNLSIDKQTQKKNASKETKTWAVREYLIVDEVRVRRWYQTSRSNISSQYGKEKGRYIFSVSCLARLRDHRL
jgi:hypothetical protein